MRSTKIKHPLMEIPGVGQSTVQDFLMAGIQKINDLKEKKAEDLYNKLNSVSGFTQNKCFLYLFRSAIYYAETPVHLQETEKLNWWYWKNKNN